MILAIRRRRFQVFCSLCLLSVFLFMTTELRVRRLKGRLVAKPPTPRFYYKMKAERKTHEGINHAFTYPINTVDACTKTYVQVVIPVHSAVTNPRRRNMTRHARQGQFARNKDNNALLLFFVGLPSKKLSNHVDIQKQIQNESEVYGDIIQVNVSDAYHNVVYKSIAVLQWVSTFCPNSEFVIKIDDDVHIDPPILLWSLYKNKKHYNNFVLGELRVNIKPERSANVKWHITHEEWPGETFPPFVLGAAIGYPTSTVILLHRQARKTRVIWLDDIFLTGICAQVQGIPVLNDTNFAHVHRPMRAPYFVYFD